MKEAKFYKTNRAWHRVGAIGISEAKDGAQALVSCPERVSHPDPVIGWRSYAQVRTLQEIMSAQGMSCQGQIRRSNQNQQRGTLLSPKSYHQSSFLRPREGLFQHTIRRESLGLYLTSDTVGGPPVVTGGRAILIVSDPTQMKSDEKHTILWANHKYIWKSIFLEN